MLEEKTEFFPLDSRIKYYGDNLGNYEEMAFLFEVFFSEKGLKIEIC
jgi:hypothetical protein